MKKMITTTVAVFMAVLMIALIPLNSLAATKKQYISEILMAESQEALTKLGYTALAKDLNAGGSDRYAYIGYKTTTNPEEAITDISVMDMKGGYSFSDYKTMLERQEKAISERMSIYRTAIDEFRERYNDGSKAAVLSYESLNGYIEDDSGKLLGDMLVDPALSDDDLLKIIMQCSMLISSVVAECLAIGLAQDGEGNWLSRISENEQTAPEAFDEALMIVEAFEPLREKMQAYLDTGLKLSDRETNPDAFADYTEEDFVVFGDNGILYETLAQYKYKDGTVADLFMSESIEPEDLYPLIAALTPGQLAIAQISGFHSLIKAANVSDAVWDDADEYAEGIMTDLFGNEGKEKISVYIGVDREMFEGGIALTSEAMRKSKSTGDNSWWYGNISAENEVAMIVGAVSAAVLFASFFATFVSHPSLTSVTNTAIEKTMSEFRVAIHRSATTPGKMSFVTERVIPTKPVIAWSQRVASFCSIGMWVSGAVICLIALLYLGTEVYGYFNPEYTVIPLILMDLKFGEDDELGDWEKYIKYHVVLNAGGSAGDLNGFSAKQWNAMYVTKDKSAGNPIEADSFKVQYGDSTTPRGCLPVHYFGGTDAFNLNSHCYDDDVGGIFMFFRSDENAFAPESASVFGTGLLAAATGLGGLAIGAFGAILLTRKKD